MPLRAWLAALCACAAHGHGYLLTPVPRQNGGDMSGHQDDPSAGPCKSLPPGAAASAALVAGQAYNLSYTIVITHGGFCSLRWARDDGGLAYDGSAGALLWSSDTCGDTLGAEFDAVFVAPPASAAGRGVLQWFWNGGGQIYQDCVDVDVLAAAPASASASPAGATDGAAGAAATAATPLSAGGIAGVVVGAIAAAALLAAGVAALRQTGASTRKRALRLGAGATVVSTKMPLN